MKLQPENRCVRKRGLYPPVKLIRQANAVMQ